VIALVTTTVNDPVFGTGSHSVYYRPVVCFRQTER
jgi:hypothetical protein